MKAGALQGLLLALCVALAGCALPEEPFCQDTTATEQVCYGDKFCDCSEVQGQSGGRADKNGQCPSGCTVVEPSTHEQLCETAVDEADPAVCMPGCDGGQATETSRTRTAQCCTVTFTRPCTEIQDQ